MCDFLVVENITDVLHSLPLPPATEVFVLCFQKKKSLSKSVFSELKN